MDPWLENFYARRKEEAASDRTIEFLGETLAYKPFVAPELGFRIGRFQTQMADYLTAVAESERKGTDPPETSGVSNEEMLEMSEWVIRGCLEPGSLPAWERLRSPDHPEPLGLLEIYGFATFLLSKVVELPTGGPSASSDGSRKTASRSKGKSSSTAAAPKA